ncbi:hypothetical protein WAE61_13475 [Comamonadaceae bacterium PP-2]
MHRNPPPIDPTHRTKQQAEPSSPSLGAGLWLQAASRPLSGSEAKALLRQRGLTLKQWAASNGYAYDTVSAVVRGVQRANYGVGYRIALQLGLRRP